MVRGAGHQGHIARIVARPQDAHVQAGHRQGGAQPLRPLDEGHALGLALVDQAAGQRIGRVRETVRVQVEGAISIS